MQREAIEHEGSDDGDGLEHLWDNLRATEPGGRPCGDNGGFDSNPWGQISYTASLASYATVPRIHAIVRGLLRKRKAKS